MTEVERLKNEYLSVKEAREVLKVSHRTIANYLANGIIPYSKPQGRIYIKRTHLIDFIEGRLK